VALLVPRARSTSRWLALGTVLLGARASRSGSRAQQALVLGALSLGMPHGAADTELLRAAAGASRRRHAGLLLAYAVTGAAATAVVHRGGHRTELAVLAASAAHFAEGEAACWPASSSRRRTVLRAGAAALTTIAVPAAVGTPRRAPGSDDATAPRAAGDRSGLALLRDGDAASGVLPLSAAAGAAALALALDGDREAAADVALLLALPLLAPPAAAFAAYFGGWHSLRHTARVADELVGRGLLPAQPSLPRAVAALSRRSAWAVAVGIGGAAVFAARDPQRASDNAFAAVLGLTVPHMATVAWQLARRRPSE
jgi:beta-carotene 15,15'-dioxygenase